MPPDNLLRRLDDGLSVGEKDISTRRTCRVRRGYPARASSASSMRDILPSSSEVDLVAIIETASYEKTRYALVMPISADAFESDQVQALELAMKSSSFAPKIAWEICERRRHSCMQRHVGGVPEADLDRYAATVRICWIKSVRYPLAPKGPFRAPGIPARI
mgnify:CR=1 FL=1